MKISRGKPIGSSHYFCVDGKYYPIDSDYDCFKKCLKAFDYDVVKLAETYYSEFVGYILKRKPDIAGHFDVITKFDEIDTQLFLNNDEYRKIAKKYIKAAARAEVIFEVNTGAMARKVRKTPYLGEELLSVLKNEGSKVILSSDSHSVDTLDYRFDDMEYMLRYIGFDCVYELRKGSFQKRYL